MPNHHFSLPQRKRVFKTNALISDNGLSLTYLRKENNHTHVIIYFIFTFKVWRSNLVKCILNLGS